MARNIDITIPERGEGEPALTDKQLDFTRDLIAAVGAEDVGIEYEDLGKWQASALIDQLIELRDEGAQVASAQNSERKMTPKLGLAIFLLPYFFAWVTLLPGFSSRERLFSFYLVSCLYRCSLHRVLLDGRKSDGFPGGVCARTVGSLAAFVARVDNVHFIWLF